MDEPPRKRRMITSSWNPAEARVPTQSCSTSPSNSSASNVSVESISSRTSLSNTPLPRSACDFVLEIENFIPVGCLRVERCKCQITAEMWTACSEWHWLGHSREIMASKAGPFLQNTLQEFLFNATPISAYRNLHQAGWIRLEFKIQDTEWGQMRVYILPEDVGRRLVERNEKSLRQSLQRLMLEIDTNKATWNAEWSHDTPVVHLDTGLGRNESEFSLFYLFNSLPSPTPDPCLVRDPYVRDAMDRILNGKVLGLKTTMLAYQRRSAAMMLQKEAQPSHFVDPRLRKVVDQNSSSWYCDTTNGSCLRTPRMYEAARGGICAETMGLGKTLICLALILATRELSSEIPVEYSLGTIPVRERVGSLLDMSAATIGRTGTPWKEYVKELEDDGSNYSRCKDAIRRGAGHYYIPAPTPIRASRHPVYVPPRKISLSTATLVIVPSNLVRQWEREIEKHTTGLKVLVMRSSHSKLPPAAELVEYDIILFSRQRFDRESKDGSNEEGCRPSFGRGQLSQADTVYHSPLRDLHFKRLITDEGHTMGNARNTTGNNAVIVVDSLQLTSRWIVSGTPTQGLYGVDSTTVFEENDSWGPSETGSVPISPSSDTEIMFGVTDVEQERKDLEKLGNIATTYLKARPWTNSKYDPDFAAWSQYVMQPRHGSRSRGNLECLRGTLEGMIIRHRPADVEKDIVLPPLHQKIVYLDGSLQDKLSLNLFSLVVVSNAVQSERKDTDYLFHHRQRKALGELVGNLRQASFFWCGFTQTDIETAIQLAKSFLAKGEIYTSENDKYLLRKVIECGEAALSSPVWRTASEHHEMPIYVQNDWATEVRKAWALDIMGTNPTLLGSTQLLALQKFVHMRLSKNQTMDGIEDAGRAARASAIIASSFGPASRSRASKTQKRLDDSPALAGGIRVVEDLSPRKKRRPSTLPGGLSQSHASGSYDTPILAFATSAIPFKTQVSDCSSCEQTMLQVEDTASELASIQTTSNVSELPPTSAKILSTASSKLSYLIDQILMYQRLEKIIVFYETDNVAYYLAQALEAVNVEHLIYAKSLSSDRRSSYIVTFNQSAQFRVLLMDISQAAFGLDVSSASRVYFINPVFHKQVEAQAVKRAHRIGQFKDVYVETLVLRGSIEEVIIERRKAMSNDEQKKCKTVLDDETMYDWIKNVRFVPLPREEIASLDQMAPLKTPQPVFTYSKHADGVINDPDAGLLDFTPSPFSKRKGKSKTSLIEKFPMVNNNSELEDDSDTMVAFQAPANKRQKTVIFQCDNTREPQASMSVSPLTQLPSLRQLNTTPYPYNPASPAHGESFSATSSREGSPSKAQKSRLDRLGALALIARFRGGKSPSPCLGIGAVSDPGVSIGSEPNSMTESATA